MSDELPPDPWPEVKPHTVGAIVIDLTDGIRVTVACLDCDGEVVGEACCPAHGADILAEHAVQMGTT